MKIIYVIDRSYKNTLNKMGLPKILFQRLRKLSPTSNPIIPTIHHGQRQRSHELGPPFRVSLIILIYISIPLYINIVYFYLYIYIYILHTFTHIYMFINMFHIIVVSPMIFLIFPSKWSKFKVRFNFGLIFFFILPQNIF